MPLGLMKILEKQADLFRRRLYEELKTSKTLEEIYAIHSSLLGQFYHRALKPLSTEDFMVNIDSTKMTHTMENIQTDLAIAHEQANIFGEEVNTAFTANRDYRTGLRNRVEYLSGLAADIGMMTEEDDRASSILYKDSLTSYSFLDQTFGSGTTANISTAEGVAYLGVDNSEDINEKIKEIRISGNGSPGNYQLIKKINLTTFHEDYDIHAKFKSDELAHDDPDAISDGESNTWFEYQLLGVDQDFRSRHGLTWGGADPIRQNLTLRILIELEEACDINWIDITPYIPEKSRSNITLHSARISTDGSNYNSVFPGQDVINQEIHGIPQTHLKQDLFDQAGEGKFISQGILSFPTQHGKFLEIIFQQNSHYAENLGTTYYERITLQGERITGRQLISAQQVPSYIVEGPVGRYRINSETYILKNIEVTEGWRYFIGLRDLQSYHKVFHEQSEIISQKFETPRPIKTVALYANELIPDAFMAYGLENRNNWLKYYISINDNEWHQISPMHHNQVGSLKIPPKFYEINSKVSSEERLVALNRGYLKSEEPVSSIRVKIVFSRPSALESYTPILEEYALKCVLEEGIEA